MEFEYNGNLLEEERINLVATEILQKYPEVDTNRAMEAALLEGRISGRVTINERLNRLYNIMLVNRDNKGIVAKVFTDFKNLLLGRSIDEYDSIYIRLCDGIISYLKDLSSFPFISDY